MPCAFRMDRVICSIDRSIHEPYTKDAELEPETQTRKRKSPCAIEDEVKPPADTKPKSTELTQFQKCMKLAMGVRTLNAKANRNFEDLKKQVRWLQTNLLNFLCSNICSFKLLV